MPNRPIPVLRADYFQGGSKLTRETGNEDEVTLVDLLNDLSDAVEALDLTGLVDSVYTRTGDVVAAASDYDASQVDNDSGVSGAFVSDALDTLAAAIPSVPVTSVHGRVGDVVAAASDYTSSEVDVVASGFSGNLSSADDTVQKAFATLDGMTVTTTPGGSDTQVQYNNSSAFGGSANMVFDGTKLTVNTLELSAGTSANEISVDGTLAGDSDDAIPTEKAVKAYADGLPGGTPAGADTQIQFNNSGAFGGSVNLEWDGTLRIDVGIAGGTHRGIEIRHHHSAFDKAAIHVQKFGRGYSLEINCDSAAIDPQIAASCLKSIYLNQNAKDGYAIHAQRAVADVESLPLAQFQDTGTLATQPVVGITRTGTSSSDVYALKLTATNGGAGVAYHITSNEATMNVQATTVAFTGAITATQGTITPGGAVTGLIIDMGSNNASAISMDSEADLDVIFGTCKLGIHVHQDVAGGRAGLFRSTTSESVSTALVGMAVSGGNRPTLGLINQGAGAHIVTTNTNEDLRINPNGAGTVCLLKSLTLSAVDIITDTSTGTKIATAAAQKIGIWGATPISQLLKASYNDWAAFSDIVDALVAVGLFDQA